MIAYENNQAWCTVWLAGCCNRQFRKRWRRPQILRRRSTYMANTCTGKASAPALYYPGQKKEPSPRFAVRRTLFDLVITSVQRRARSSATQSATFALRWSCVIEHNIRLWNSVLLTVNLWNGSFFFVQGSKSFVPAKLRDLMPSPSYEIVYCLVVSLQVKDVRCCIGHAVVE